MDYLVPVAVNIYIKAILNTDTAKKLCMTLLDAQYKGNQ
jgi:hypothetical protein